MRWVLILDRDAWEEDAQFWGLGKEGLQGGGGRQVGPGARLVHGELTEHTPPLTYGQLLENLV